MLLLAPSDCSSARRPPPTTHLAIAICLLVPKAPTARAGRSTYSATVFTAVHHAVSSTADLFFSGIWNFFVKILLNYL